MGMYTDFLGTLTTSRPLTPKEVEEYKDALNKDDEMYLVFSDDSRIEVKGPEHAKVCGYLNMEEGFMKTVNWMKHRGITLYGRINYASEYIFYEDIGLGFGAFVVTPENVTYYKLDFNGLKMVSNVIY